MPHQNIFCPQTLHQRRHSLPHPEGGRGQEARAAVQGRSREEQQRCGAGSVSGESHWCPVAAKSAISKVIEESFVITYDKLAGIILSNGIFFF